MAANDYYQNPPYARPALHTYPSSITTQPMTKPYHDYANDSQSELQATSPFDDRTYPYSHPTAPQRTRSDDADPFQDENAIPMRGRRKMADSTTSVAPMLPHEMEDPFVRDVDQQKQRRNKKETSWLRGRITWVVYILTAVQLIVFIVEIVKNGKYLQENFGPTQIADSIVCSRPDQVAHRDTSFVQSNDRSFAIRADQHGFSLSALHAHDA